MAIQNDFLPFAVGAGANVLSQASYEVLAALASGFQAGTAQSAACNKVWRQTSIMTAVVSQFIVAQTNQPAVDDGTTTTLLANFTEAVASASKNSVVLADTGAANAYAAENAVPFAALPTTSGVSQTLMIEHTNTGPSTYAPDSLPSAPIFGAGGVALQGGELVAGGLATLKSYVGPLLNGGGLCWVLVDSIGGARQVAPAVASSQAVQLGQVAVLGGMRGLAASLTGAGLSVTFTAAAVVAKTAAVGAAAILPNFNQTLNVGAVGAGGMDTGAPPASGYLGIYAIYNPTSGAQSILATNATAAAVPEQYAGGSMPAGFTYSQLIGVWPTNGSGQLVPGAQRDRHFNFTPLSALTATSNIPTPTALNISTIVPKNASAVGGVANVTSGDANPTDLYVYSIANASMPNLIFGAAAAITVTMPYAEIPIITPQVLWCSLSSSSIAFSVNLTICSFRF
ncbi:hypothetical protein [Burkholderia gladioli]|uniref:hypothetical protein n=1 Tax=Burkholderia gladioli TaxID=28095 RepID=UPI003D220B5F